ncbi:MAG: ABC transporter permease, partial [Fibrobacter sp.]|nr:ABC transporter permease [Fibrobacter sp.]
MTTIILPDTLTAANSKDLLRNCTKQLRSGALCLDGSNLASKDYSADAFIALLAELAEKTGNKLTLAHFNEDIKAHLKSLRKMDPPDRPVKGTNNVLEMLGGLG